MWQQDTLYSLARVHARQRPTACALRDVHARLTWRELVDWAKSTPAADQVLKDNARPMGARRGADFSETRNWPV